jgi:tetratricopeptide (TPR) repeat protein
MSLAYEQLGDLDGADTVLLDAIDLVLRPVAADSAAALDLTLDRARLALRSEHYDRAATLGRRVLRGSERIGAGDLTTLAHSVLGRLEIGRGRPGDAIPHFRAALETGEYRGARWSEEARLRSDLGLALNKVRRHDEAAAELRTALDLLDAHGGGRPAERARVLHNLGVSLCGMEDYAAAVPLLEETARLQRSLPERRAALGSALNDLANAVWETGDDSRALVLYLEALKVKREVFGHDSATTVSTLSSLGDIQVVQGQHAEAVRSYRDAVAILTAARGPDHPTLAIVSYNLGNVLEKMGLLPEALRSYAEAARVDSLHLGEDHPYVVESREAVDRVRAALEAGP